MIDRLLSAICGKCDVSMLHEIASLLNTMVNTASPSDVEAHVIATLRGDHFRLGEPAKHVTLSILQQCQQHKLSLSLLQTFLHEVWEIHQAEDSESLPTSDVVATFIHKYTRR